MLNLSIYIRKYYSRPSGIIYVLIVQIVTLKGIRRLFRLSLLNKQ
ncbi:MAG: hypothetical protein RIR36_286 [Bacteroidota bacterium]